MFMKKDKSGIRGYILKMHMILIIIMAILIGTVGIGLNLHDEASQRDRNLRNIAEAIAASAPVLEAENEGHIEELEQYLDTLYRSLNDIDVISVVGSDRTRLYHSNHDLIGTVYDGVIPSFSENEQVAAVSDTGPSGPQRRVYAVIRDSKGDYAGFVIAIMLMSNIRARTTKLLITFILVILAAMIVEILISYNIAGRIRDRLMGYEPDAFTAMYRVRDNILEGLEEGVIAIDSNYIVQFENSAASKMTKSASDIEKDVLAKQLFSDVIGAGKSEHSVPFAAGPDADILIDRYPLFENGQTVGAIGILHDRTAYTRMAEDLAGTRFLVDSMRANNHDFTNKLHVILGLLQMEMYDEAMHYIQDITIVQRETVSTIMHAVNEPAVAALLIGKISRASELNVNFVFRKDSRYIPDEYYVPEDALITIIGNLIDNALDAMNTGREHDDEGTKELCFGIYSSQGALLITVDDTGNGISEANLEHIFDNGFSTKGEGRGTGLYQTKKTIDVLGGEISVESQEGEGTSFTVSFTGKKAS